MNPIVLKSRIKVTAPKSTMLPIWATVIGAMATGKGQSVYESCDGAASSISEAKKTCANFCAGRCAFVNKTELPTRVHTLTLFRETPFNTTMLAEKDCGDAYGDVGFYLANHNLPYLCHEDPNASTCRDSNAIEKGSQNNVFIQFDLEVDGNFGPYEMCNPLFGWDTHHWECLTYCETPPECPPWRAQVAHTDWMGTTCFCFNGLSNRTVGRLALQQKRTPRHNTSIWPSTCANKSFFDVSMFGKCVNGTALHRLTGPTATEAACCAACGNITGCRGWSMFNGKGKGCVLIADEGHSLNNMKPGDPCISAFDFNAGAGSISNFQLGGYWYSIPAAGECRGAAKPGDGSGCTWRLRSIKKVVNSSCVSARIDAVIENHVQKCLNACPARDRHSHTSLCYTLCYAAAINGNESAIPESIAPLATDAVVAPFLAAFDSNDPAQGGCPALHISGNTRKLTNQLHYTP